MSTLDNSRIDLLTIQMNAIAHRQHKNYDEPSKNPYDPNRSPKGWVLRQLVGNVLKDLRF